MWKYLLLGVLCGGLPREGAAQSASSTARFRLNGAVWDSTLAAPLSGASVQAVRADDPTRLRTSTTDARGNFRLDSLEAGDYAVVVYHPRLDSLGIQQLSRGASVGADTPRLSLFVPSARTLVTQVCGAESAARGVGYLRGMLRDAEQPGATRMGTVQAEWQALRMEGLAVKREMQTVQARTDSAGVYVLCGVPANDNMQVRAWSGADSTGIAELLTTELGIVLRDLYTGRVRRERMLVTADSSGDTTSLAVDVLRGPAVVRGRIDGAGGRPLSNAQITVWGTGVQATSSDSGRFVLPTMPTGTHMLDVRVLGYRAARQVVDIVPGDSSVVTVSMMRTMTLDTVRVQAGRTTVLQRQLADFEERRRTGATGRFFGPEDLAKRPPTRTGDILRMVPGVRVVPATYGERIQMRGLNFNAWCTPDVWVDGIRMQGFNSVENMVQPDEVRAVEVYANPQTVPAQFTSLSGCGVILFWTGPRK
jgi:Carboxypeptidase regulatory-like domain/TonB-dependent Receptor Plug Domain